MAAPPTTSIVLSFEDARHQVESRASGLTPPATQQVALLDALGCILAEPILADRDFPPFPRATRDGYAVRSADLAQLPATLTLVGEIRAGDSVLSREPLEPRHAFAIMTGAPAPPGADAVVMIEYTSRRGGQVEITKGIAAGENIVPTGAEARRGALLLPAGTRLDPAAIALAASVGRSRLSVYVKPRVAILATGDELTAIDAAPAPHQIRNSNSYSLAAQVQAAGGQPVILPIAPDRLPPLRDLIVEGLAADLLLLTGGVSVGKYDLVEQALSELHAEFFFTGALIQPGRPIVFGRVSQTAAARYFFGLPGNPVSTMVTFELFVQPLLAALAGASPAKLIFVGARSKSEIRTRPGLKRFLPAILSGEFEQAEVELLPWQGSGDMAATARANCYIVVSPDRDRIPAGEPVSTLLR